MFTTSRVMLTARRFSFSAATLCQSRRSTHSNFRKYSHALPYLVAIDTHGNLHRGSVENFVLPFLLHKRSATGVQRSRYLATGVVDATTFHKIADETLEQLSDELNDIADSHPQGYEFDVDFGDAVLTVDLADHGTYVINKQTPNQQIWLSSPTSGPKRYDFDMSTNTWVYSHDNVTLHARLSTELSAALGQNLVFEPPALD
eukprot:m.809461 g.809461  ORF g.809461 m.809461 type:complete len:202 (+) comp23383_c1_seq16:311-916(+)